MGYSRKKKKTGGGGGGEDMEFPRVSKKLALWNFQGLIKDDLQFPRQGWPRKKTVEFPRVFVFGIGISNGCNTILWNIQQLSFVLSRIYRDPGVK